MDGTGIASDYDTALLRIREAANAPIFGYFKGALGKGIVGGRLFENDAVGVHGARVACRILRGERAGDIAPQITDPVRWLYDARELERWGIPESVLPPGSAVLFRETGPWERYRGRIVAIGLFVILQTSLIVGLLISRSARRKSEEALRAGSARISSAIDIAGLGFYEMGAARRMIDAGATGNPDDVRETVEDIVADAGRAGEIVRRVRGLVKREAPVLGPVDLNDIVDEVLRLVYADIAGSGISVQLELSPELPKVRSDRIQLQQVLLNLLVNAVDALRPVPGDCP